MIGLVRQIRLGVTRVYANWLACRLGIHIPDLGGRPCFCADVIAPSLRMGLTKLPEWTPQLPRSTGRYGNASPPTTVPLAGVKFAVTRPAPSPLEHLSRRPGSSRNTHRGSRPNTGVGGAA